ncbi:MAG: Uma2 family endonuclease [Bacteroidota bacterium]
MEKGMGQKYRLEEYQSDQFHREVKHEFHQGRIIAMTGGSLNHGIIIGNIQYELRQGLAQNKKDCQALGSEGRVHVAREAAVLYPDAMVVGGPLERSPEDTDALINPILLVEVLSKSTEAYDRGDKFYKYRQLASFQEYLLIDSEKMLLESFYRQDTQNWEIARATPPDERLFLKSLGFDLELARIYQNVSF